MNNYWNKTQEKPVLTQGAKAPGTKPVARTRPGEEQKPVTLLVEKRKITLRTVERKRTVQGKKVEPGIKTIEEKKVVPEIRIEAGTKEIEGKETGTIEGKRTGTVGVRRTIPGTKAVVRGTKKGSGTKPVKGTRPGARKDKKRNTSTNNPTPFRSTKEAKKTKKIKKSLQYILLLKRFHNMINYKNVTLLKVFLTKFGKIRPRRKTRLSIQKQRKISKAIRKARAFKLIPFTFNLII